MAMVTAMVTAMASAQSTDTHEPPSPTHSPTQPPAQPPTLRQVVLNAGISMGASFTSLSKAGEAMGVMRRLMDVNYFGAVGVIDALLPLLENSPTGVRILAVSSVVGLVAPPTRTGYAASKFALKGFCDALRCELIDSPNGCVVTLAYPGAVRTEINSSRLGLKAEKVSE